MVSPVAIVLQFFSGVFAVYSELPLWMQQIAMVISLHVPLADVEQLTS